MCDLSAEAVDLLFDADRYAIDGARIVDEDTDRAAAQLVHAGFAVRGIGPCDTDLCDCDIPVIRLTAAGVAELGRRAAAGPAVLDMVRSGGTER